MSNKTVRAGEHIHSLHISARRWFQKSYGNTYHSVEVFVNGKRLYEPFEYGYGDHFLQTAAALLRKHGYDTRLKPEQYLGTRHLREVLGGTYSVAYVSRKEDL